MSKPNALVKVSGDLLDNLELVDWIKVLTKEYAVTVLTGGGKQINNHFKQCRGHVVTIGPLGRETNTLRDQQAARDILEENRIIFQDYFDRTGLTVRTVIPVLFVNGIICHVNGDLYALFAYNGFKKVFITTLPERVKGKEKYFAALAQSLGNGPLKKLEIKGFALGAARV